VPSLRARASLTRECTAYTASRDLLARDGICLLNFLPLPSCIWPIEDLRKLTFAKVQRPIEVAAGAISQRMLPPSQGKLFHLPLSVPWHYAVPYRCTVQQWTNELIGFVTLLGEHWGIVLRILASI
jgi:hypothetical protein